MKYIATCYGIVKLWPFKLFFAGPGMNIACDVQYRVKIIVIKQELHASMYNVQCTWIKKKSLNYIYSNIMSIWSSEHLEHIIYTYIHRKPYSNQKCKLCTVP